MVYNTRKKNDTLQFRIMITKIMERVKIQLWNPGPYHVSAKKLEINCCYLLLLS